MTAIHGSYLSLFITMHNDTFYINHLINVKYISLYQKFPLILSAKIILTGLALVLVTCESKKDWHISTLLQPVILLYKKKNLSNFWPLV